MTLAQLAIGAATALQRAALLRRLAVTAALGLVALLFAIVAMIFAATAGFLALQPELGAPGAAAAVAGAAALVVLGLVLAIRRPRRAVSLPGAPLAASLRASAMNDPVGTSLVSVAAGLVLGLLLRR